mmetsp:Transcript_4640/g.6240  ORF Transcript_4640/g.6240 Transcript_4640/m.6240 type:complete len:380 (-) Transcript_4640:174-1313(-)
MSSIYLQSYVVPTTVRLENISDAKNVTSSSLQTRSARIPLPAAFKARKSSTNHSYGRSQSKTRAESTINDVATKTESAAKDFDFKEYMLEKGAAVEAALDKSIVQQFPDSVHESMRYSLMAGGKRIRPILCIAAYELFQQGDLDPVLPTACAMEMLHTMSLIHDDLPCMDNDDYRRGKLTNHKVYGEQVAILAGDGMLTRAFEYIARETDTTKVDPLRVLQVISLVGKCVGSEGLVGGQIVDIEMEGAGGAATLETLEYIHHHKTAALLEASVVSGACLGGASADELERLTRYSRSIGLGFQVIDDILDCTKSSEELGKTAGKDIAMGKTTYPSLLGLEESKRIAQELIDGAKEELSVFPPEKAAPLLALADFICSRQN